MLVGVTGVNPATMAAAVARDHRVALTGLGSAPESGTVPDVWIPDSSIWLQRLRAAEENLLGGGLDTMSLDELYEIRAQFHEVLVAASGNIFFIDALRRVNQMRRLLAYRSMRDRDRYVQQAQEHLAILDCLERGENVRAAELLAEHLGRVAERWRLSPLTWKS